MFLKKKQEDLFDVKQWNDKQSEITNGYFWQMLAQADGRDEALTLVRVCEFNKLLH